MISKQLNGANLEASAYLSDNIRNKCPMQANTPIEAIMDMAAQNELSGLQADDYQAPK